MNTQVKEIDVQKVELTEATAVLSQKNNTKQDFKY